MTQTNATKKTIITQIESLKDYLNSLVEETRQNNTDDHLILKKINGSVRFYLKANGKKDTYLSQSK